MPRLADVRNNAAMGYVADGSMLAGSPLFAGLDAAAREDVAAASHLVRLQASETLFEQDSPAAAFYVLITGRVKIAQVTAEGHQVVIRYIAAGRVFGAVPLFTRTGYPASATGVVDSIAARWDEPATHQLFDRHPRMLLNALTIVGERLQELQNRYRELATERVEQRVARAVLRLFGGATGGISDLAPGYRGYDGHDAAHGQPYPERLGAPRAGRRGQDEGGNPRPGRAACHSRRSAARPEAGLRLTVRSAPSATDRIPATPSPRPRTPGRVGQRLSA